MAEGESPVLSELIDYLEKLTRRAYQKRTHRKPKFDRSHESCVRVIFDVTPRINIDIVPIVAIEHDSIPNWGLLPKRDGTRCHTSISEHVEFVRSRNKAESAVPFHQLVRLMKRWRNNAFDEAEREKLGSFLIELILAKAFDEQEHALTGEALPDLGLLARSMLQHGLAKEISFPDSRVPSATVSHSGPVIVIDPMNRDNNLADDWTIADRDLFLERVDEFRDILRDAELEADDDPEVAIEFLEQVFPDFSDLSDE